MCIGQGVGDPELKDSIVPVPEVISNKGSDNSGV